MKRSAALIAIIALMCTAGTSLAAGRERQAKPAEAAAAPKPLGLQDILAWKSIPFAALSADGAWLIYRLSPVEGDEHALSGCHHAGISSFPAGGSSPPPYRLCRRCEAARWPFARQASRKTAGLTPAVGLRSAPRVGLEPTTLRLTAACSAN